jgi:dimethylaniline monooxygenase (N-oxide forming)
VFRIAIIGAGVAGLVAAKEALAVGLIPVIFEKASDLGGVWRQQDGLAWPGMQVNISRYTSVFSDFPWPDSAPDFPLRESVYEYLYHYATHFKLHEHIQYGREIILIDQVDGKWEINWKENNQIHTESFDGVIIASGKFCKPVMPTINGLNYFQGEKIHSAVYRSAQHYKNKRVLIVGNSHSGTSIAEEVAKTADFVTHVFNQPRLLLPRYLPDNDGVNVPRDFLKSRVNAGENYAREHAARMKRCCVQQQSVPMLNTESRQPPLYAIADSYFKEATAGKISPLSGNIDYFTQHSAVLKTGEQITTDAVIFCTGYQQNKSCFSKQVEDTPETYNWYEETVSMLPGLAFIGFYTTARGATFPLMELQARFACAVFSYRIVLPEKEEMLEEMIATPSARDEIAFSDALAKRLEVLPNLVELGKSDPELARMIRTGVFVPAQYRLNENREQARRTIVHANERYEQIRRLQTVVTSPLRLFPPPLPVADGAADIAANVKKLP